MFCNSVRPHFAVMFCIILLTAGCVLTTERLPTPTAPAPDSGPEIIPAPPIDSGLLTDANILISGVCFESAFDAKGRLFKFANSAALNQFYNLVDNSQLCRHPAKRYAFDFSAGHIIAGLWSYGHGCTARHDLLDTQRDDANRVLTLTLRFVTEGDCNYELIRPYWVSVSGVTGYEVNINVEN